MKCLSTRTTPEGFKRRRYESEHGSRHTTIEVPLTLWTYMNKAGRSRNRVDQIMRAQARQHLKAAAIKMAAMPEWRTIAIANELGMPVRTVQRWITTHKDQK